MPFPKNETAKEKIIPPFREIISAICRNRSEKCFPKRETVQEKFMSACRKNAFALPLLQ